MGVEYMDVETLALIIRGPDAQTLRIIDVRDEDFEGGHIKSCVNVTSEHFCNGPGIDNVIQKHCQPPITKVAVHCMFSQQRGPRAAMRLAQRLMQVQGTELIGNLPAVFIVRGGWDSFYRAYNGTELVEE